MRTKPDRTVALQIVTACVIVLLMIVLLRAQGRLLICACGEVQIWTSDTCSSNNSQHLLDPYSFTHVLHGVMFFWLITLLFRRMARGRQVLLALLLEAVWEVIENSSFIIDRYRTATAALGYQGDTVVNSIGDLLCALLGYLIARKLGVRRSLILFLLVELILILWIHDSLLLQILMLLRPIAAIKLWQACGGMVLP